jgi:hypothetical protein
MILNIFKNQKLSKYFENWKMHFCFNPILYLPITFLLLIGHVSGPFWASCDVLSYPFPTCIAEFHKRNEPTSMCKEVTSSNNLSFFLSYFIYLFPTCIAEFHKRNEPTSMCTEVASSNNLSFFLSFLLSFFIYLFTAQNKCLIFYNTTKEKK